ncbi:MAG: hypothetical protein Q7J98_02695 [Kiritimatiellia bacterium]|nr:hypothetical protein [Kiritimatiellia bacterium]
MKKIIVKIFRKLCAFCLCASVPSFTLIELLVVIILMAIIIGISAPAFVGMGRGAGMRGAVRSVHSTLSLVRQWAITHKELVFFHYSLGNANEASFYYASNSVGMIISNELPREVMFAADNSCIFKTDGGLNPMTTQKIIIKDRKVPSQKKTISINGLTGGIRVE